jgi:hypothetical protein
MKVRTFYFAFVWSLLGLQICFGQAKPQAQLIDQLGDEACAISLIRIDNFLQTLHENPSSVGYAVIHPGPATFERGVRIERMLKAKFYDRKFDPARVHMIRSDNRPSSSVEFWVVPPGASPPAFVAAEWNVAALDLKRPFVFGGYSDDSDCWLFVPEDYARLIKENKDLRGHIVFLNYNRKYGAEEANRWIKILTADYGIPRRKLRLFFAAENKPSLASVEFWVVPPRRRGKVKR